MKKINLFNRNTNSPSYRRMPVSRGIVENRHTAEARCPGIAIAMTCPAGDFSSQGDEKHNVCDASFCIRKNWIPAFAGMTIIAIAALFATPSFAEPTELDKKTVASKAYVDTKQDKITTGLVEFNDNPEYMLPAITTYDSTSGLVGNKIGILDYETISYDEGNLELYGIGGGYGSEMDNYVPTVRAVAENLSELNNIKQYKLPAAWISTTNAYEMASTGGQTIDLTTTEGLVGRRYITAGGSQPLTQKTGADNVILYINGTKTLAQYQTSNFDAPGGSATINQNYIKGALVSLELLKDVYSALHNEIQNATPTGTPGNVAMYDATTGALGDGVATYSGATAQNPYNATNDAAKIATAAAVEMKQDIIETGNVTFDEYEDIYVPGLVAYDSQTNALSGNKVGILDWDAYQESSVGASFDELGLFDLYDDAAFDAGYLDNYIPTVRFVVNAFKNITWDPQDIKAIRIYNTNFASTANSASLNWLGNGNSLISGLFLAKSLAEKQNRIAKSGYYFPNTTSAAPVAYGQNSSPNGWLYSSVKGTGLVTKTASNGVVGERKIFEATDVANYHADGLTQIEKDIQDISIPTVGAVMSIVNTNAPTGTPGNVAMYDASTGELGDGVATYSGATAQNPYNATNDAAKIATAAAVETKQTKRVCAGYEPGHENEADYCWLWDFPD